MKTYKLEIIGFDQAERRRELYALACDCQQIVNCIWQLWEQWHVANDSQRVILAHLAADKQWREGGRKGKRPKWPVDCLPKVGGKNRSGNARSLRNHIESDLLKRFPQVHSRVRSLLANITFKKITQRKASNGSMKGWVAILLNRESRPSSTRPVPIPFDRQNSRIVPGGRGENASLQIRLVRDVDGKSEIEEYRLKTTGRAARYVKPIVRMASGEWEFKGSSLLYDTKKRKWFAQLSVDLPPATKTDLVVGRVGLLRCGKDHPFQFRVAGHRAFLRDFGHGRAVASVRKQLLTSRWSRQENYRVAGSANKGHGRNRALGPVFLLSRRWKDFVKRYNHTLTTAFINRCAHEGVAKIIYFQPSGGRFLDTSGKVDGREDSTGWDYFQIKTMLAYKCQEAGIEFESVKSGAGRELERSSCASG